MGGCLSCGLGNLLRSRAYPHDPATCRGLPPWPAEDDSDDASVVQARERIRRRSSARRRRISAKIPPRPPGWPAAREPIPILSALSRGERCKDVALLVGIPAMQVPPRRSAGGAGPLD